MIAQGQWTFFHCGGCGFVFMHPMLSSAEIAALYSNPASGLTAAYFRKRQSKMRRARLRVRQIARRIKGGPVGCTFLDLGCSGGFTTEAARALVSLLTASILMALLSPMPVSTIR